MALTFAETHNMIAYLTKSDASEGFEQILDFLNASVIKYALTVNPTIYVSCIKQFWSSISLKKTNDVVRLHALIDRRKVIITKDTVRQALRLDDANSIDCLPNEEIFAEFERMGDSLGVDTPLFEGMLVPHPVNDDVADDVVDVASTLPSSPHQSPIAPPSSPPQQQPTSHDAIISMDLLNKLLETCATLTKKVSDLEQDKIAQAIEITKLKQRVRKLEKRRKLKASWLKRLKKVRTAQRVKSLAETIMDDQEDPSKQEGKIAKIDADDDVTLEEVAAAVTKDAKVQGRLKESQAQVYHLDLKHAQKVLSMHDDEEEPAELTKVIEVVTTAKLMIEVVTAAATNITAAPSAARKRKGVVIRDPKKTLLLQSLCILSLSPRIKEKEF
nr:hypothetical protein [Tanacetum cinerariifolium]